MSMEPMEKLAILTAMEKAVKERIKDARAECNALMEEAYGNIGAEKIAMKVNGAKVGDMTVTFNADGFAITDKEAFEEFAVDYGLAAKRKRIRPGMEASVIKALEGCFAEDVLDETVEEYVALSGDWEKSMERVGDAVCYMDSGMVVPGVSYRPKTAKGTMVRGCRPDDVLPIVAGLPGGIDGLLLGEAQ